MYLKICKYINLIMPSKVKTNRTTYMRRYMYLYRIDGDKHYQKKKVYLNEKVKCEYCSKCISRQNLKRHIKNLHRN